MDVSVAGRLHTWVHLYWILLETPPRNGGCLRMLPARRRMLERRGDRGGVGDSDGDGLHARPSTEECASAAAEDEDGSGSDAGAREAAGFNPDAWKALGQCVPRPVLSQRSGTCACICMCVCVCVCVCACACVWLLAWLREAMPWYEVTNGLVLGVAAVAVVLPGRACVAAARARLCVSESVCMLVGRGVRAVTRRPVACLPSCTAERQSQRCPVGPLTHTHARRRNAAFAGLWGRFARPLHVGTPACPLCVPLLSG